MPTGVHDSSEIFLRCSYEVAENRVSDVLSVLGLTLQKLDITLGNFPSPREFLLAETFSFARGN